MSNPTHCEITAVREGNFLTDRSMWAVHTYARSVNEARPSYIGMSLSQAATYNVTFGKYATTAPENVVIPWA